MTKLKLKKLYTTIFASLALSFTFNSVSFAEEHGSDDEAQKMVKKAVELIKKEGSDKSYKVFTEHPDGAFKEKDLYVFAYDFKGTCLAQGANAKMLGKNLYELKDADGNPFIKNMIDMVKSKQKSWYGPYKFTNPATGGYSTKKSYCESSGETMICVGVYVS